MVIEKEQITLPRTLAEFEVWEPNDGFKYEWNDGELIKFTGMNRKQIKIYDVLLDLFIEKGYKKTGTFVAEYDVMLSGIQMRRPDIAYLTKQQIEDADNGKDVIPEFVIELLSNNDNINQVERKIVEYYKAGVKVVWLIYHEEQSIHVYTSRKTVKICTDDDICSASPVMPDFEITVNDIFA